MPPPNVESKMTQAQSVRYTICIKGLLELGWAEWFEGFTVSPTETGETIISGLVVDQAALNGLLNRIFGMNLILISVKRIELG
jgi:hypothetical protein